MEYKNIYLVYLEGYNGMTTLTVNADNESHAINRALKIDGAPWASVYEVELVS
jgi:hypothetical protein